MPDILQHVLQFNAVVRPFLAQTNDTGIVGA